MYTNESATPFYQRLQTFRSELANYSNALDSFLSNTTNRTVVTDLRRNIAKDGSYEVCDSLELHPDGLLKGFFGSSGMLSKVPNGGGYVEALVTPLRHVEICFDRPDDFVMDMHYLIHDFASLCRKLSPTSRTVFIDMGAALDYHSDLSPAVYVTSVYQKFGFKFDHIYAYEISEKNPDDVYGQIPDQLKPSYHWYNVGVEANISSSKNPMKMLLDEYDENDFVVVKLDVDTHSVEQPMVENILANERLLSLIDVFYFEHHVHLKESAPYWDTSMVGTVEDSLQLFAALRERGVASHYWP
jgi:hypothetical protein